ncbi:MAG TPA: YebC/PmpR family DNA-binding transcriptional regulator [Bacteroidia bacterium]|jgi:YebC/PmpR family DNA-binding regulatory protein|nr:YebC/PmpR family DNA-binding transcriptional regulator [Bacteroidia bacterium]
MGRVFEKRKHTMFARFAKMAKTFTRIGKEIHMAVKKGGPDPDSNPRLRLVIQNAKAVNMPKTNIDSAIQRAVSKDKTDYEEVTYEGYGPHAVAVFIETATDNTTRTVANVRLAFTKCGGALGKTGSLEFIFDRKGLFEIDAANRNMEELELELIDHGMEEIEESEGKIFITVAFTDFGKMQKALEDMHIAVISAEKERFPNTYVELNTEQQAEVMKLIERLEDDEDVQAVYHNMKLD